MKKFILLMLLVFPMFAFSQDVNELFLQIPNDALVIPKENRPKLVIETKNDLLKFRLSEARKGEFKVISENKDEILVGMTISNCDGNSLQFWKVKKGVWKDVTKSVIKPIGKDDIANILRVSPVSVDKANQDAGIAMLYEFSADSDDLRLIARKQDSCDIAGTVYNYKFNGKKFEITQK